MKFRLKSWFVVPVVLIAGAGLTLAMPTLSAVGQASPPSTAVRINGTADLLARGVGAKVVVRFVCPASQPFSTPTVTVTLIERFGTKIVSSSATKDVTCTGSFEGANIVVPALARPWERGSALAEATLNTCSFPFGCSTASNAKAVQLH